MIARLLALCAVVLVQLGCASQGGMQAVGAAGERVSGPGFSVLPPAGRDWHQTRGATGVVFMKRLTARNPEPNSIFAAALAQDASGT